MITHDVNWDGIEELVFWMIQGRIKKYLIVRLLG